MPANHCKPHTDAAKAKIGAAKRGKPATWNHRATRVVYGVTLYRCGACKNFFPKEEFHSSKRTILGIKSQCKRCHNACGVASRDPAKVRAAAIRHGANRRALKAGTHGKVTAADWREVLEILGSACLKCGATSRPSQDHIVPLAKGGLHHPRNLQPLCCPCNERKQARTADYRTPEQIAIIEARWANPQEAA